MPSVKYAFEYVINGFRGSLLATTVAEARAKAKYHYVTTIEANPNMYKVRLSALKYTPMFITIGAKLREELKHLEYRAYQLHEINQDDVARMNTLKELQRCCEKDR